jgi:hypothetical protein
MQQLSEDQAALEESIQFSKVKPLTVAIGELGDDLHKLADDLRIGGFGQSVVGSAKSLRDAFVASIKSSKGSAVAEMPWLMLRSIVVKLNNELDAPDSAFALMKGLLDLGRELDAPEDVQTRLREDARAIERHKLERELLEHMKNRQLSAALPTIENLLQDYKSPDERDTLQKLKSDIERKKRGTYLRWGFWIAVALGVIVMANMNQNTSGPARFSAPSAPGPSFVPSEPNSSFVEEMPPVGTDTHFSKSNIRYCMFQEVRLDYIKPRISTNYETDKFNQLVDDYNSRCGSYRYMPSERSAVEAELSQKRSGLELQAQRVLNSWQR